VVYRDRGYFETKSKIYDATMKRAIKEHPLGITDILRNQMINQKIGSTISRWILMQMAQQQ
jgi:IS5 family transposase